MKEGLDITPDRWPDVSRVFSAAATLDGPSRHAYLDEACRHDPALRTAVESLLGAHDNAGSFGEAPVIAPPGTVKRLAPGSQLGPFRIETWLGAGGMGEVYRANDTKLQRAVAIKVLPDFFAQDPNRLARFEEEARALAALNHPHVGAIYGVEERAGIAALVLELVEGPTLAERLAVGPLSFDEVIWIARQLAEGLEAAHERGIVHRDLKPANIKITPDGNVKILDFGLAKTAGSPAGTATASSVAVHRDATQMGAVLGTVGYMSPEQARGQPVDKRTDIWAFGCVLFEMCAHQPPFTGATISDAQAAVIEREPDWELLRAGTPANLVRLVRRCLTKDPKVRLRDIGEARIALERAGPAARFDIRDAESGSDSRESAAVTGRSSRWRERAAWIAASLMTLAVAWLMLRPAAVPAETRVDIGTPPTASPLWAAISPDGETVAFVRVSGPESQLLVRSLRSESPRTLPGTEGAEAPFWSPDSKSIGFFADGTLKRIDVEGGSVQTLANSTTGTDGSWGAQNVILFAARGSPISRVPAQGGEPTVVSGLKRGANFSPHFLPDGRRFLYYHRGSAELRGVYVGDLEGSAPDRRLLDSDSGAVYAPSGHLLFVMKGTLFAQRFDRDRLAVAGDPFPVAGGVAAHTGQLASSVSVSTTGSIAYRRGSSPGHRQLVWFDRSGKELQRLGSPSATLRQPSLSRDGERVVFYRNLDGNVDIWTMDTRRGAVRRLTSDPADDVMAISSADGTRVIFTSNRSGALELYSKPVSGTAPEELLFSNGAFKVSTDCSWDGRYLLFTTEGSKRSLDIWALPLAGDRKPFPVVQSPDFAEMGGQFSPDGNWIAYQSNESGRPEIYLQRFPGPSEKVPISTTGGSQVRWRADGAELIYVARNGDLIAVPIQLRPAGQTPVIGAPAKLFTPEIGGAMDIGDGRHQYMVAANGQRVLVATVNTPPSPPISLIINWKARP